MENKSELAQHSIILLQDVTTGHFYLVSVSIEKIILFHVMYVLFSAFNSSRSQINFSMICISAFFLPKGIAPRESNYSICKPC